MPLDLNLIPLAAVTAFAFVSFGMSSFGENIIFHIGLRALALLGISSSNSLLQAVTILTLIKVPIDTCQFFHLRKHVNIRLALTMGSAAMVCSPLGTELLVNSGSSAWMRRALGIIMLFVFSWRSYFEVKGILAARRARESMKAVETSSRSSAESCSAEAQTNTEPCPDAELEEGEAAPQPAAQRKLETDGVEIAVNEASDTQDSNKSQDDEALAAVAPEQYKVFASPRNFILALTAGCVAGFLSGMFSVGGPPLMLFAHISNIAKNEWRATGSAFCCMEVPVRLVFLVFVKKSFEKDLVPDYITALFSGLFGVALGNFLSHYVSQRGFMRTILSLLLIGGIMMFF